MFKKLPLSLALVLILSCCASADGTKIGILSKSGMTEEQYSQLPAKAVKWSVNESPINAPMSFRFYDDLPSMIMGLNAGEVDEIVVAKVCGEYILNNNPDLKISGVIRTSQANFSFGFLRSKGAYLCSRFNYALGLMRRDGTLAKLRMKYFLNPGGTHEAEKFDSFPGGDTVKIALTGDVPPIDFVTADGKPAGFSTAVLAEIGRRLGYNIEAVSVNTASRVPALASGRADVIFWMEFFDGIDEQPDVPADVMVSDTYYNWDIFVSLRKK